MSGCRLCLRPIRPFELARNPLSQVTPLRPIVSLLMALHPQLPLTFAQAGPGGQAAGCDALITAESDYVLKDFHFAGGESLPELKLHYRTIGRPARNPATGEVENAVLLIHGTTGTGKGFLAEDFREAMFQPGQPLDPARYYSILPDAIGLGGSSKPSDGLHDRFPHYGYHDMVAAEQRLVTDGLGIKRLRLIFGISMGGMHAWLWAERYPTLMDAIIPVACQPDKIAGRNLFWRRIVTTAIRSDPAWRDGDYHQPPPSLARVYPIFRLMTSNVAQLQKEVAGVEQANAVLERIAETCQSGQIDANDLVHRLEASADYDPAPDLEKIQAAVLAINFADDELYPPELGSVERARARVRHGQFVLVPASSQTNGHMTLLKGSIYAPLVADFLAKLAAGP
ncbi:MAG: alpha/beta fold hydrolase [Verrucomicrobia bacterium]|nr:alpha/beta fold hydrolase [Verrucomicrobiota bacterium]